MTDPHAIVATGRISIAWTTNGQVHKTRAYVRQATAIGGTWNINSRTTDANDTPWKTAAEGLFQSLSYAMSNESTAQEAVLELRSGTIWTPTDVYAPFVTFNGSGASALSSTQTTLFLKDALFNKLKVIVLEGNEAAPQHWNTWSGGDAALDNFAKQFLSNYTVTVAPYLWMVSKYNQYLASSAFVGLTVSLNRKVRRRRGLT